MDSQISNYLSAEEINEGLNETMKTMQAMIIELNEEIEMWKKTEWKLTTIQELQWKASSTVGHVEKRRAKLEVKVEELNYSIKEHNQFLKSLVKREWRNFGHEKIKSKHYGLRK